ncbi:AAA ATPase-like protein [Kribbella sp. VKM Ac-2527]|uniref:AAA ATPase-like protein n=1 Tax=Kribbella caucasensis TaxID=2512215 RepID=A0A4R6KDP7_9ACTN|nr:AAA family ATPase [Kribbella sp. VKM Ac-2527]TDO48548.1 AAA ATPase-like protein [Kribbella sp. VKM Ac-2527]
MSTELIGRDDEIALLRGLIGGLTTTSAVAIVRGEAGIGKTVLVRAVLEDADRLRILRGGCAPMSGRLAYGGLDRVLTHGPVDGEAFSSVAAGRARTVEAMLTTLTHLAHQGAILVVEDVHWADTSTLDFLAYASRNLPESGLLILLTWRDEPTDLEHQRWLGELLRAPPVTDLPLSRLTMAETAEQLSWCSPAAIAEVYRRSAGNPYLSVELAQGGPELPDSLRQVLLSRLESVSPPARVAVAATATLGRPLADDELLAAGADADALQETRAAGLMVRDPAGGWAARHPVLGEVAYELLIAPERRLLHQRLAARLEAALPPHPTAAELAEVAEQYQRTDDPDATLRWAVRAAESAERSFAIAEAGDWYAVAAAAWDTAAEARSAVPEKLALLISAATHLNAAGQARRAIGLLADDQTGSDDLVVRAALTRGWLWVVIGDTDRALRDVERAEQLTPRQDEATWARIHAARAMALGTGARWDEARQATKAAFELGTSCGDLRTVGTAHFLLGIVAALEDRPSDALGHHEAALAIARRIAEPEDIAMAAVGLSDLSWRLGDADRAVELAARTRSELRRLMLGRHWLEDLIDVNVLLTLYEAGRWDEALSWAEDAGEHSEFGVLQAAIAQVQLARGDVAAAAEMMRVAAPLHERDQPQFVGTYGQVQCRLLLQTDRPRDALELALTIAETVHGGEDEFDETELLIVGLDAAARLGAADQVERLATLLGQAGKKRTEAAMSAVLRGERSRASGASDPGAWLDAAAEWAAVGRPYDAARSHLRAGEAILASQAGTRARRTAAQELRAADELATGLGAEPLLGEIRSLAKLARVDLTAREHRGRAGDADRPLLTDRETQVLELLLEGRTNREIGQELYMSPKTASVHVTHILEKLGVRTRVQAAAAAVRLGLGEPRPGPD